MVNKIRLLVIFLIFVGSILLFWPIREPLEKKIPLGLDLKGGAELVYRLDNVPQKQLSRAAEDARGVIHERIDRTGLMGAEVRTEGDHIVVTLPGADAVRVGQVKKTIEQTGNLEFRFVVTDKDKKRDDDEQYRREQERRERHEPPAGKCHWYQIVGREGAGEWVLVEDELQPADKQQKLSGAMLDASGIHADVDQDMHPCIAFRFNPEGAELFGDLTAKNCSSAREAGDGRRLAIILNEQRDEGGEIKMGPDGRPRGILYSDPVIQSKITDHGVITGSFTAEEVNRLVNVLKSGALPGLLVLEDETQLGPTLGDDTIRAGLIAMVAGLVFIFLFMSVYYRVSGMVACFALLLNLALTLASVALLQQTLTLPGIAGLILSVGMAVDAHVLVYERIREEMAMGKGAKAALEQGYHRALSAIVDSNITTLLIAMILWGLGTGPIKGFGITLTLGLLFSMFTALYVSHWILTALVDGNVLTKFRMFQMIPRTNIKFSRTYFGWVALSALVIGAGVWRMAGRGDQILGIDFKGGTIVQMQLAEPVETDGFRGDVQKLLAEKGYRDTSPRIIPYVGEGVPGSKKFRQFAIHLDDQDKDRFVADLRARFGDRLVPEPFPGAERRTPRRLHVAAKFAKEVKAEELKAKLSAAGYPNVEVSPKKEEAAHAEFDLYTPEGTVQSFSKALPKAMKDAFYSDRFYPTAFEGEKIRYQVRFRNETSAEDLQKRLREKGFPDAEAALPAGKTGKSKEMALVTASKDLVGLEDAIDSFSPLGDLFETAKEEPARIEVDVKLASPLSDEELKKRLLEIHSGLDLVHQSREGRFQTVTVGATQETLDSLQRGRQESPLKTAAAQAFRKELSDPFPRAARRGPAVANQTKQNATLAILYALMGITVYVWFRFDLRSGVAAVVALIHDVLVALACVALFNYTIDMEVVGAFLTIIGYSINDTIVIYDRLRENLKLRGRGGSIVEMMDLTVNQSLARSLITNGLTLSSVLAVLFFAGKEVEGFAFTMTVGMISGTYSTIYIVGPILTWWSSRADKRALASAKS